MASRIVTLVLLAAFAGDVRAEPPPEPAGYRMDHYRAPVPESLAGARVITTEEAEELWREGEAIFIDVLPRPPRPEGLPEDAIWRARPRANIPGSLWLANTGFGALAPEIEAYFRDNLASASGNDLSAPLVIYCQRDCWMSWNAAKRAVGYGYEEIIWYPEGTDGWADAGLPLETCEPVPR